MSGLARAKLCYTLFMTELEVQIRQGKVQDFEKRNQEWAWSPHNEWQQIAQKDYANGINRAYLSAFRVHPDYRGQGLGTKLMQRVIERIKEKGFNEVTIGAYHHESQIQDLYKKWEFTDFVKEGIEEKTEGSPKFLLFLRKL